MKKVLSVILSMVMVMCFLPTVSAEVTIYGDVDGDGVVNALDSLNVLYYGVGKTEFTDAQLVAADVTGDGVVNAEDALLVLQRSVGKITYFSAVEDGPPVDDSDVDNTPIVAQINGINFPDYDFFDYVRCEIDLNEDYKLSEYEISKVTTIKVGNYEEYYEENYVYTEPVYEFYGIRSLKGIEFFTELEYLSCSCVSLIGELDVSKNTKLEYLDCSNNPKLTSLNISNNPLLKTVSCAGTAITELNLSDKENLILFKCDSTCIETLDLTNNTKLTYLRCGNTNVATLDLTKNTELESLYCVNTNITVLDLTNNTKLEWLGCDSDVEVIGYTGKRTEY